MPVVAGGWGVTETAKADLSRINDFSGYKKIVVVGHPKSGKTTFAQKLSQNHVIVESDSYFRFGHEKALYMLIDDLSNGVYGDAWIVEGTLGYRLLRKIEELDLPLRPDLIVVCTDKRMLDARHVSQSRGLDTIWDEYLKMRTVKVEVVLH